MMIAETLFKKSRGYRDGGKTGAETSTGKSSSKLKGTGKNVSQKPTLNNTDYESYKLKMRRDCGV